MIFVCSFLFGVISGLRSMTAPAAISWAVRLGLLHLESSPLAFLGSAATSYIFSLAALAELIADKLPKTPSRKLPAPFAARIVSGAFCGAAIGVATGTLAVSLLAGAVGAVAGTLGGAEFRSRLVKAIGGNDLPIALLEDIIALGGSLLLVSHF